MNQLLGLFSRRRLLLTIPKTQSRLERKALDSREIQRKSRDSADGPLPTNNKFHENILKKRERRS
jgi:hypothetical protein